MTKDSKPTKSRVSGVILIDKPQGITSQQVVSKVKYLLKSPNHDSKKAGHTGTLDPMATGLLPVCLGEATKFSHYQLDAYKSYQAVIKLGQQTDTGDAEGQVVTEMAVPDIDQQMLNKVAEQFTGYIEQIPPMYSALKKDGKKLYEYARAGIEVERKSRPLHITKLSLQPGNAEDGLILDVTCSKGTYVRVLGEDIAAALGSVGHLTALRRTQVGEFDIANAITLDQLEALEHEQRLAALLGIDACIPDIPVLVVSDEDCARLHMGQRLNVKSQIKSELETYIADALKAVAADNEQAVDIRLFSADNQFLGLGRLEANGRLQPKKMIQR
ncbi:tRNA pseudouridine(55) synthase TruB [Psychrobacter sp. FDAARGOS_221]|uniref:tRNA pseudouridine(55) synthase TruB n=1 Tax=Psychrobacter sp. FDAARGOS_221 TaxID=1975705 RepID=UPI000BB556E3|nr:tRNA pseudouridine(55) synthase TruB [Psychrobacter sp. FDAARGOS_221]PNK60582.1 tRNA pseudouridine(55) synthase TruB [Psychrobacter sp. FDAARGOS_221]